MSHPATIIVEMKTCSTCGLEKPRSEFNRRAGSKDGLRGYCRKCHVENASAWIGKNRERFNTRVRSYRAKDPEQYRRHAEHYRLRDPAHWLEVKRGWARKNPVARAAIVARYHAAHREQAAERSRLRHSGEARALPPWADRGAMWRIYREARRLTRETGIPHEVDHIVPLISKVVCGLHCEQNLQVLPRKANRAKSNKFALGDGEVCFRGRVVSV